jgi:hypothetical protein
MIWMERDLEAQKAVLHEIDSRLCDDESRLFGVLFFRVDLQAVSAQMEYFARFPRGSAP